MRLGRATLVDRRWRVGVTLSGHRIDHLQVSDQRSTKIAVAVVKCLPGVFNGGEGAAVASLGDLGLFRREFYECLSARADVFVRADRRAAVYRGAGSFVGGLVVGARTSAGARCAVRRGEPRPHRAGTAAGIAGCSAVASRRGWAAGAGGRCVPVASAGREYLSGALVLPLVVARTSI
jgi:hypothetical protein